MLMGVISSVQSILFWNLLNGVVFGTFLRRAGVFETSVPTCVLWYCVGGALESSAALLQGVLRTSTDINPVLLLAQEITYTQVSELTKTPDIKSPTPRK